MFNFLSIFLEGILLSIFFLIIIITILFYNPRLMLKDYPQKIQQAVPKRTPKETKQFKMIGFPFV